MGTAGVGGGLLYWYEDEGTRRAMKAYSTFVPVVLHYRWVEARHKYLAPTKSSVLSLLSSEKKSHEKLLNEKELDQQEKEEEWKALDDLYANRTVERLGELQGMYCKYGQTGTKCNHLHFVEVHLIAHGIFLDFSCWIHQHSWRGLDPCLANFRE